MGKIIPTGGITQALVSSTAKYVHITEYGNIGEYIAGNFDGNLVELQGNSHIVHFDFRIKRSN
jgi:hypothetical protein